jgi:hypothetical protein
MRFMKYLLAAGLANCQENAKLFYYTRLGHKLRLLNGGSPRYSVTLAPRPWHSSPGRRALGAVQVRVPHFGV